MGYKITGPRPWFNAKFEKAVYQADVIPRITTNKGTVIPEGTLFEVLQDIANLADSNTP